MFKKNKCLDFFANYVSYINTNTCLFQMKNDFKNLEEDMKILLSKMDDITKSSETITSSLHVSKYFIEYLGHLIICFIFILGK